MSFINYIEQNGYQSNSGFKIKQGEVIRARVVFNIEQKVGLIKISLQRSGGGQLLSSGLMDSQIGTAFLEFGPWVVDYPVATYDLTATITDDKGTTLSVYKTQHIVIAKVPSEVSLDKYNILAREIIPRINTLLGLNYSGGVIFKLPEQEINYPAATTGNTIVVNPKWFQDHPGDEGAIVHELVHVVMHCPKMDDSNSWLIEGIADYVRDKLGYMTAWSSPSKGDPKGGYQATAHFLLFLEGTYGLKYIQKLALNLSNSGDLPEDLDEKIRSYR